MNDLRGKGLVILAIVVYVVFFSYRYYVRGNDAAALQQTTLEHSIQRMAVFSPKLLPPEGTITLPGNIQAGYETQIYAQVSGSGEGSSGAIRDLFTVADVSKMRLFVSVPEAFGPFLQPGLTADVTVPQLPNRHFTGKFLTVAHGFDVSTRTAITVFEIDNEDGALWPGSYATVRIMAPVDKNILAIPTTSLAFREHGAQIAMVK